MKAQSITLQAPRRTGHTVSVPMALYRARKLPCLALVTMVSALPSLALVVLATWASGVPTALAGAQAVAALSGLVFLALALDSEKTRLILQTATAAAMFALTWASAALSPEFIVLAAMVVAAWTGGGLFYTVGRQCLGSAAQDRPPARDVQQAHQRS